MKQTVTNNMPAKGKEVPMGFTGETFPPGIHMCYIYTDEDERKRIIFQFLDSGLRKGEKVSYFMDANTADTMKECQSALDVDKFFEEQQGHFSVATTREAYCPTGIFVPNEMLDRLSAFYTQSVTEGYAGARVTGEMSWAVGDIPGSLRLIEYEARVNTTLIQYPVTAICQYDAHCFNSRMLRDVLAVHPMIILHGQILKNPHYIKSWWLLKRHLALDEEQ